MACQYCGNSYVTATSHCEGCGSPKTARPSDEADQIYVQIGRSIMARKPDEVIDWLTSHTPSPYEDDPQKWIRRSAKVGVCLLALAVFPQIFAILAAFGIMFSIWVYLPYRGLKALLTWIAA